MYYNKKNHSFRRPRVTLFLFLDSERSDERIDF